MRIRNLLKNDLGNVAIIFALSVVPLLLAVGCAIDYVRAMNAQTTLQNATDSAVLAAGASDKVSDSDITALVNQYLTGNKYDLKLKAVDGVTIAKNSGSSDLKVHVDGEVATSFMSLAGYETIDISADSGIVRGSGAAPLELALVLDTTWSMNGSKIADLKTAAKNLAHTVLQASTDAKVSIVPFSNYVKVGVAVRNEPWMNVPADYSTPGTCTNEYPNETGCTITYGTCSSDGIPYQCVASKVCTDPGPAVPHCYSDYWYRWYGCAATRDDPHNTDISAAIANPYPGILDGSCANELTDLTDNKSTVDGAIDALGASFDTYIPSGLIWGWNTLDPEEPLQKAKSYADVANAGGKKALVLMTDGENTLAKFGTEGHVTGCLPDCSATDTETSQICENIKATGIIVYTVLFDVSDPKLEKMLQDCASSPANSYVASDGAALIAAFGKIGKSLTSLRLSN